MKLPSEFRFAYHRTSENAVSSIAKGGFTPGYGDMYGRGWYMCYDLESQLNPNMLFYGDAVIRSELYSKGLLIFDYNVAKRVYGSDYNLISQALEQKIYKNMDEMPLAFIQMSKALEDTFQNPKFSASIAANAWTGGQNPMKIELTSYMDKGWRGNKNSFLHPSLGTPKNRKITSIMFTGNHDGNVVVVYSPNTAKPVDYAIISRESLNSIRAIDDIEWIPIKEAEVAQKRADLTREVFELFKGDILNLDLDPNSSIKNVSMFKAKFPWLLQGRFSSASFEVHDDDNIVMTSGVWLGGVYKGLGMDRDVIFKSGIFEGFDFHGQWIAGRWGKDSADGWSGYSTSKSKFTYATKGNDYITIKENPDEYFSK